METGSGDWDFTKTEVLEEETQVQWEPGGARPGPTEQVRIYHRGPGTPSGPCLEFDGETRVGIGDRVRVGRNFFNEVVIFGDAYVSRRHAEIGAGDAGLYVVDLGSRNGTYINGRPIPQRKEVPLQAGDVILFGSAVEARVLDSPTAP